MATSREIIETYGVSPRTARRHARNGTLPSMARTVGRDGKSYPAMRKGLARKSPLHRDIAMARNAIRRLARAETIYASDLGEIETIRREAIDLWRRWREAVDAAGDRQASMPLGQ
jgi:hypothetical protein